MASSPSSFSNNNNNTNRLTSTTFVFAQPINNTTNIRPTNTSNGTIVQSIATGLMPSQTNIVRLNQPTSQFVPQTVWTNNSTPGSPRIQFSPTIKTEPVISTLQQQMTVIPNKLVPQPVVRQTVPSAAPAAKFTDQQINDFVAKCRTFLITLLKLAEKQAPEKLPMVRKCIQDLLEGTINPESFTERLHTLYKSQPHTSLVPFFKLALPYMRQMVQNTFGRPISIELLERLNLPTSGSSAALNRPAVATTVTTATTNASCVVVNPSLLSQTSSSSTGQQPLLYTTVQPQQKINLLQGTTSTPTLISANTSLLSAQQQQQQQARAQINISGIRPIITSVASSSNSNLLNPQTQPITQTIIPQSDSLLQRTFLTSASTSSQAPQIITVNPQAIKTEITGFNQQTIISSLQPSTQNQIQLKPTIKTDDESSDEHSSPVKGSSASDDRHTRHMTHEKRFLPGHVLRRRLDHLIKTDSRWEGGSMVVHDDSVLAMISHATEERLKCLIEQMKSIVHERMLFSHRNSNSGGQEIDSHSQMDGEEQKTNSQHSLSSIRKCKNRKRKLTLSKRLDPVNLSDVLVMMKTDRHLRRSALYLKTLDKSC